MPKGWSGANRLYSKYKTGAKKYGRDFQLTFEEFHVITSTPCHYCGCLPDRICKIENNRKAKPTPWGDYIYNGIDRMNNDDGYTLKNSLPSCYTCNRAKCEMTYEKMMECINRIKKI